MACSKEPDTLTCLLVRVEWNRNLRYRLHGLLCRCGSGECWWSSEILLGLGLRDYYCA